MDIALRPLPSKCPRRFTTDEVGRMVEAGIMGEDKRLELIDGELIEMAPKGAGHDIAKSRLNRPLVQATGDDLFVGVERPFGCPVACSSTRISSSFPSLRSDATKARSLPCAGRISF
jgi:hypothetical protein